MKELTTELLLNISDDDMISKLLLSNEEFLLEQLNNVDAVLEPPDDEPEPLTEIDP